MDQQVLCTNPMSNVAKKKMLRVLQGWYGIPFEWAGVSLVRQDRRQHVYTVRAGQVLPPSKKTNIGFP